MGLIYRSSGTCSNVEILTFYGCKASEGSWNGFDISGHIFLILHSSFFLLEEMHILVGHPHIIGIAVGIILCIWFVMMIATCIYFHPFSEIVIGASFGLGYWFVTHVFLVKHTSFGPYLFVQQEEPTAKSE